MTDRHAREGTTGFPPSPEDLRTLERLGCSAPRTGGPGASRHVVLRNAEGLYLIQPSARDPYWRVTTSLRKASVLLPGEVADALFVCPGAQEVPVEVRMVAVRRVQEPAPAARPRVRRNFDLVGARAPEPAPGQLRVGDRVAPPWADEDVPCPMEGEVLGVEVDMLGRTVRALVRWQDGEVGTEYVVHLRRLP